jgi:LysM repeat protein
VPTWTPTEMPRATDTATPVTSPTAQPEGQIIYTVQEGDTLSLIANQFELSLNELYSYNSLTADSVIQVGQQLLLGFSMLPDGSIPLEGFPSARVLPDSTIVHTVSAGDSFYAIAATYDLTLEQFYEVSGLDETSILQIGQEVAVGEHPLPEEIGGSTDLPAEMASPTSTATTTTTPVPSATAGPAASATALIVELATTVPTPTETPSPTTHPGDSWLTITLAITGFTAVAGALFYFYRR